MIKKKAAPPPSLAEFAHQRKVEAWKRTCIVCKLPAEIREQVRQARERKVERSVINDWIRRMGYKIDDLDWQTHNAGLHEQRAARRMA